jgi:hypothetical protein
LHENPAIVPIPRHICRGDSDRNMTILLRSS